MSPVGASLPSELPRHSLSCAGEGQPGHFTAADQADVAGIGVLDRKVNRVSVQEDVSVREFTDKLDELVTVLDETVFVGTIRDYLERSDGAQNLMGILPDEFIDQLRRNGLARIPHNVLAALLRDAIMLLEYGADLEQTKAHFRPYVQVMDQVFTQGIFRWNEDWSECVFDEEMLFGAVVDLQLCLWQRQHSKVWEIPPLGDRPWENHEILSALARQYGFLFCPAPPQKAASDSDKLSGNGETTASGKSSGGAAPCWFRGRQPKRFLNPLRPPFRRHFFQGDRVKVELPNRWESYRILKSELEKLAALETGFYALGFHDYLFVGDAASAVRFSVYLATGVKLDFQTPDCLYSFLAQRGCLFTHVQRLQYSPEHFTDADTVRDQVSEALVTLGISQESLLSMNRQQFLSNIRKKIRQFHPDKVGDTGHDQFCRLMAAREVIESWLMDCWVDSGAEDGK